MASIRPRLTYADVASTQALILVIGTGGAHAAGTIGSADIFNGSIKSVDLKNDAVKSADMGTAQSRTLTSLPAPSRGPRSPTARSTTPPAMGPPLTT
jgi:hypothetical protein